MNKEDDYYKGNETMGKERLVELIENTIEVEKNFHTVGGNNSGIPAVDEIHDTAEFQEWIAEVLFELENLPDSKKPGYLFETINILKHPFNGWNDKKDFIEIKGRLAAIKRNINNYYPQEESDKVVLSEKIAKGSVLYTAFEEYVIQKQVGQGGNGTVFQAKNTSNELYAIKVISRNTPREKLNRFRNEINFCMNHEHKNIVKILDYGAYGDESGYLFYVMPLYDETLRDRIKAGIKAEDSIEIFENILNGLQYAHNQNCFHRDIKPENILFKRGSNQAVIADFGIAHFCEEEIIATVETKKADRLANFQYAAPEQREKGATVDGRADVYAAGLILNEMFTRKLVAGGNYKRIGEVDEKYDYLDKVFEGLYCQNPNDRLFPVSKILLEIDVRAAKKNANNLKKEEAQKAFVSSNSNVLPVPQVVDLDIEGNELVFTLSGNLPQEWYKILTSESFSHTSCMGYDTHRFNGRNNKVTVGIRVGESDGTIKQIVGYFKSWLPTVTGLYNIRQKQQAEAEFRKQKQAREQEIKRLEDEASLKNMLKDLL